MLLSVGNVANPRAIVLGKVSPYWLSHVHGALCMVGTVTFRPGTLHKTIHGLS